MSKKNAAPQEPPPTTTPPPRTFVVAVCLTSCAACLGHANPFEFFGGDVVSDRLLVNYVARDPHFRVLEFSDRAGYDAWLADRDVELAALSERAASLGFELRRHGEVFETSRGLALHRRANQKAER